VAYPSIKTCVHAELLIVLFRVVEVRALSHMNYAITYELTTESGAPSNEFAIDPNSGVVDLLRTLDYETDPVEYHLRVKAFENRRQAVTSTVNVQLLSLSFCTVGKRNTVAVYRRRPNDTLNKHLAILYFQELNFLL